MQSRFRWIRSSSRAFNLCRFLAFIRHFYFSFMWPLVTHTWSNTLGMSVALIWTRLGWICLMFICMQIFRKIHTHFTICLFDLWSPSQGQPRLACQWPSFEPGSDAYASYECRFLEKSQQVLHFAYMTFGYPYRVNHAWDVSDPHSNPVWMHMLHVLADFQKNPCTFYILQFEQGGTVWKSVLRSFWAALYKYR